MKTILLLLLLSAPGQGTDLTTRKTQKIADPGRYQFDKFVKGKVYLRYNSVATAFMNYNYLYGAVQFLDAKGDTLLLTNKERVKYITIGDAVFYPQENGGDVQWLGDYRDFKLARKRYLVQKASKGSASEQKYSAGFQSLTPSTLLISNQGGEFQWQNNTADPDYMLKYAYFVMDQNGRLHPASKNSFLKVFAKRRRELANYLQQHPVNFQNEEHLNQLLAFCSGL